MKMKCLFWARVDSADHYDDTCERHRTVLFSGHLRNNFGVPFKRVSLFSHFVLVSASEAFDGHFTLRILTKMTANLANPLGNTANENMAIILQQVLRETRALREDNERLRDEIRSRNQQATEAQQQTCGTEGTRRRRRRKTASKDCQVV